MKTNTQSTGLMLPDLHSFKRFMQPPGDGECVMHMKSDASVVKLASIESRELPQLLMDLIYGRQAAVVIDGFTGDAVNAKMAEVGSKLITQSYEVAEHFERSAEPLFSRKKDTDLFTHSQRQVRHHRSVERLFTPLMSPGSKLHLNLDISWHSGAQLARPDGFPLPTGLLRRLKPGGASEPVAEHVDLSNEDCDHPLFKTALGNLAWVSHASTVDGGLLHVFETGLHDGRELNRFLDQNHTYRLRRELLGNVKASIRPVAGRLVIFNARFAHRVDAVKETSKARITQSGFILVHGPFEPLRLYY